MASFEKAAGNAYRRWGSIVAGTIEMDHDPRTLADWGRHLGASRVTLLAWCAAAGQGAKASLDLARLLRIVVRSHEDVRGWDPAAWLSASDPRTVRALLARGGLADTPTGSPPPAVNAFLDGQHFVRHDRAIFCLKQALRNLGIGLE